MNSEDLQTRDRILQTSFALFLQKGYEDTPVQAIIDAVGIAKGTFYHHFRGKEEMLVELVEGLSRHVVDAVRPVVEDETLSAVEKMLAASQVGVARKVADFGPETLVLAQQMASAGNRLLNESLNRILTQWVRPLYLAVIRQGVAEGSFHVRNAEWSADFFLQILMSTQGQLFELFVPALQGDAAAIDRIVALFASVEEAVERLLGAAPGSLPIYSSVDIRGVLTRYAQSLKSPGGKP